MNLKNPSGSSHHGAVETNPTRNHEVAGSISQIRYRVITEEIKVEIKKYLKANDNKYMTLQNLWDAAKAVL
ncbi:hypothetical protein PSZ91_23665, partial [Shigella sonnei]|nr:hypothetical protein [Shigella sonnei]